MERSKIEALAKAWVDGDRDPVIAEMPTLKPSEAVAIHTRIMWLIALGNMGHLNDSQAFAEALAERGH